jgi:choline monooxygenase
MSAALRDKLSLFDPDLPLERARTIPSLWYSDPEIHAAECRSVFAGWQVAGRVEQVSEPGSFVTTNIAGEPVLVVRGAEPGEPQLRAFFNVCRHRAAQVICDAAGKTDRLRCRYHGWTYDLAGRLRGVPEFDGVAEFNRAASGLVPLAVETWGPLVWVHIGPDPTPLGELLAPLAERTAALGLDSLRFVARREYELACNWKAFVDNYLDGGYHVNTVHPGLAGVLDYSQYRTEIAGDTAVQISPLRSACDEPTHASISSVRTGDEPLPSPHAVGRGVGGEGSAAAGAHQPTHASISSVRTGDTAYYWWVFPNFMLNIYAGVMDTNLVLPLGPERCRVIFDFYFAHTEGREAKRFIEESIAVAHQIQLEDAGICEEVQRGLASRSFSTGRFSVRREAAGYHFHRLLAQRLRRSLA